MNENKRVILKAPSIDFKRIHPTILVMEQNKLTQGKVSLYFFDVISWLKSAQLSLASHRSHTDNLNNQEFVDKLNKGEIDKNEYLEVSIFYLENAVIRLSAIRDKLAITSLLYYLHPENLGNHTFKIRGCSKCGNKECLLLLNEKNCNFGALMSFLVQEKADDVLSKKLREIEKDEDIQWLVSQRNNILHRISQYRWRELGIFPQNLDIAYENGGEKCTFNLGGHEHTLEKEISKIEVVYNKFVKFTEELEPILFPKS